MKLFDVYQLNPISIEKAKGSYVWDDKGKRYLDFYGGHAVISIGHNHDSWQKRIAKQLEKVSFYSNSVINKLQIEFAEKLGQVSGRTDYTLFLCNSGAEANENAVKLASFHTYRKKVVCFSNGFHGRTSLAVALTDNSAISAPVNENHNIIRLPFNDVEQLKSCFEQHGTEIAAVITEGIQGVGGIIAATDDFLKEISTLTKKYGALFIADSVQCGYGRTGLFFDHDHAGVKADIYTVAKGMGNGFPVAGVLIAPHIEAKKGMLGTTFGGNHLACAAALSVLEVMESETLMQNATKQGEEICKRLSAYPEVKSVRGKGLMIGIEMEEAFISMRESLRTEQRVLTGTAKNNLIRLLPSMAIGEEELSAFFEAFENVLESIKKNK